MLQGLFLDAQTKGKKKQKNTSIQKYSLPVCQLPALHPGLVSHHLFLESQCLSHNPPYDCANVLPYDVKNTWSRHHWTGLKGAFRRWFLDYYWLKSLHWVLSDVYTTTSGCSLQTGDRSYMQMRIILSIYELYENVMRELYDTIITDIQHRHLIIPVRVKMHSYFHTRPLSKHV